MCVPLQPRFCQRKAVVQETASTMIFIVVLKAVHSIGSYGPHSLPHCPRDWPTLSGFQPIDILATSWMGKEGTLGQRASENGTTCNINSKCTLLDPCFVSLPSRRATSRRVKGMDLSNGSQTERPWSLLVRWRSLKYGNSIVLSDYHFREPRVERSDHGTHLLRGPRRDTAARPRRFE